MLDMTANNLSAAFCYLSRVRERTTATTRSVRIYTNSSGKRRADYESIRRQRCHPVRRVPRIACGTLRRLEWRRDRLHGDPQRATADGGYVLRGFRAFVAGDANGAKKELLDKLYSIPIPRGSTAGGMGVGGDTGGGGDAGGGTCAPGRLDSSESGRPATIR